MDNQWIFIAKLFLLSAVLAIAIKYLVPMLNIPATSEVALGLVLGPPIFMAALLAGRYLQAEKQQDKL
jgi:hypothetical protein